MTQIARRRVALFFVALASGVVALLAFRSLAGAALAAVLSGLSAQALAGTGKYAVYQVHGPAVMGAFAGSLMLMLQLRGKPMLDRIVLVTGSFVAAYFGGVASSELWNFGPGGVGVAGTVAAYLAVPALNAALALLRDIPWIKRVAAARLGADTAAGDEKGG